jgi:menaquinone-9 beta-reductase
MTSRPDVDVVIVGARCAGAALACYLRRAGVSALVLERARLPSEHVLSTHTLHPAGVAVIDELGLGVALRSAAPPMHDVRLEKDGGRIHIALPGPYAEYCPRRERFDRLLQNAATAAGAELRDRTQVIDVLRDGERVTGVRIQDASGATRAIHARLVVGADGRHSTIAVRTRSEEYLGYDAPRAMYWGYFPAPSGYEPAMDIAFNAGEIRVAFATEQNHVLAGCLPELCDVAPFRAAPLAALRASFAHKPELAELVQAEPSEPIRGIVSARYFLRRAAGPGWALVGDAGMHKEYVSGDGMSEALVQAKRLAAAIAEDSEAALQRYWHERDAYALPRFCFYKDQGAAGPRASFEAFVLSRIARDPGCMQRFAATFEHRCSPYEVASPLRALRWVALAVLNGRIAAVRDFLAIGKRAAEVKRLVRAAEARAAEARAAAASLR